MLVSFLIVCAYEGLNLSKYLSRPASQAILVESLESKHRRLSHLSSVTAPPGLDACVESSGSAYPTDPIISKSGHPESYSNAPAAEKAGIIVHIIFVGYMLLGLNTVCDIYFCGALDVMVDQWQVKPDVAGATFMAAGGSAPELFTSLIGACITENDVGFGTIVGSAVFNVLAVIGACGMCAKEPIHLTWWPLARDCTCYIIGLTLLAYCAYGEAYDCFHISKDKAIKEGGGGISLVEAVVLFCAYLGYCVLMFFNEPLEAKITAFAQGFRKSQAVVPEVEDSGTIKVTPKLEVEAGLDSESSLEARPIEDDSKGPPKLRDNALACEDVPGPPDHVISVGQAPTNAPCELVVSSVSSSKDADRPSLGSGETLFSSQSVTSVESVPENGPSWAPKAKQSESWSVAGSMYSAPGDVRDRRSMDAMTCEVNSTRQRVSDGPGPLPALNVPKDPAKYESHDSAIGASASAKRISGELARVPGQSPQPSPRGACTVHGPHSASASFGGELPGGLPKKKANLNGSKSTSSLGEDGNKKAHHHIAHHIRVVHHKAPHLKPHQLGQLRRSLTKDKDDLADPNSEPQDAKEAANGAFGTRGSNSSLVGTKASTGSQMDANGSVPTVVSLDRNLDRQTSDAPSQEEPNTLNLEPSQEDDLCSEDSDDVAGLMIVPEDPKEKLMWYFSVPVYAALYYTIPRPTPRMFMATFFVALIWIAGFSFVLVYCVELFGEAILGGGNSVTVVMSFTILAAGTSIPDLVSSMAVAQAGEGDMAVSSSIGSNIFDILVGLPVPWIIKIAAVEQDVDFKVAIRSPYIALYVLLLLFMVFCVIVSIHVLGWQLNRGLGIAMAGLYVLFLAVVLPIELNNKGPYL